MNTVFSAASESAQLGWLMGLMTAVFLFFFTAWALWAYAPKNREKFEAASRMPLDEGDAQ